MVGTKIDAECGRVVPPQQHFLDREHISYTKHVLLNAGLVKHLSPYTGRISE